MHDALSCTNSALTLDKLGNPQSVPHRTHVKYPNDWGAFAVLFRGLSIVHIPSMFVTCTTLWGLSKMNGKMSFSDEWRTDCQCDIFSAT